MFTCKILKLDCLPLQAWDNDYLQLLNYVHKHAMPEFSIKFHQNPLSGLSRFVQIRHVDSVQTKIVFPIPHTL